MSLDRLPLTVIIATKNEVANIEQCLRSVACCENVIVVDSGSTDGTVDVARRFGATVFDFRYIGGYPKKRQWALDNLPIQADWILLLDADESVPPDLWLEIRNAIARPNAADAYLIKKGFHFLGRRFTFGGFSHQAVLLFRRGRARFERIACSTACLLDMEIHERVIVEGRVGKLKTPLIHNDRKPLHAYLERHNHYSTWEANVRFQYLTNGSFGDLTVASRLLGNVQERRRFFKKIAMRMPCEHWLWFVYHYFLRLGFLEGRRGLIASQIRASYIRDVRAKLYEMKLVSSVDTKVSGSTEGALLSI